jgi:hypothetical protein
MHRGGLLLERLLTQALAVLRLGDHLRSAKHLLY